MCACDVQASAPRPCIRVYEISQMRESVRRIPKTWQGRVWSGKHFNSDSRGRVWSGKHFNSDSRLGPGPAFDLIINYYLVT